MNQHSNIKAAIGYDDLREWLSAAEALGEVRNVKGASWQEDIGLAAEAILRAEDGPCVVFDDVPGCPKGFRVLLNMFAGTRRNMTLGFPDHLNKWELSDAYREAYLVDPKLLPHEIVDDGPVLENVLTGDAIDVTKFPSPIWHEKDGGRYIGTGTYSITRDPEENWLNAGAYRAMVHDKKSVGFVTARGHHGYIHREKYWARGEAMPVVMVLGGDPLAFFYGGVEAPYGTFELDIVGGMRGRPTKMVRGKVTGLPFPANAEIVLEGFVTPDKRKDEGPFGEWTGHYAGGKRPIPVLDIAAIYHRNDPILVGVPPMGGGPDEMARYRAVMRSAMIRQNMTNAGVPGVQQVWCHEVGGARMLHAVSITQRYPGHAVQAAHVGGAMRRLGLCVEIYRGVRRRRRRHQSRPDAVGDADAHRSKGVDPVHHRLMGFQRRSGDPAGAPRRRRLHALGGADQRLQAVALARKISAEQHAEPGSRQEGAGKVWLVARWKEIVMKLAVPDKISPSYFVAEAAVELGFFKAEGLDVSLELVYPVDKAYEALRDGKIDFVGGAAHAVPAAFPGYKGAKLIAAQAQGMYWFLVMRSDLGAKRGDLSVVKGRTIGAAPWVNTGLRGLLIAAGIDLERDKVNIAPVPGLIGDVPNFGVMASKALEDRKLDGFWANGMGAEVAVRGGYGTVVIDARRGDGPKQCFNFTAPAITASDELIARSPEKVAAAVRAIVKTQAALKADVSRAGEVGRKLFPPAEAGLITELIRRDLPFYDATLSREFIADMTAFLRSQGVLQGDLKYEDVVAAQFAPLWKG